MELGARPHELVGGPRGPIEGHRKEAGRGLAALQKGSSRVSHSALGGRGRGRGLKGPTAPAQFTGRAGVLPTLRGPRVPVTNTPASPSRSSLPSPRGAESSTTRRLAGTAQTQEGRAVCELGQCPSSGALLHRSLATLR